MTRIPTGTTFPAGLTFLAALLLSACNSPDSGPGAPLSALASLPADPDLRIAVIGAGPSGLTAALTLKERGYAKVTVFEKEGRVGGKVNSVKLPGAALELGAVFASPDYELVLGLADRYGIPYANYAGERFILDEQKRKLSFQEFLLSRYTPAEIGAAIQAYAVALQTFNVNGRDGFAGLPSDLHLTFDAFARKHGFTAIAEMAKSIMVGFGYGYYETVPALYYMKLMPWLVKVGPGGLESPPYYTFPTGYQSLWEAVAGDLDVRLNSKVTRIERGQAGSPIRLIVNGAGRHEFDAVIVSAPLHVVPHLMALTPEEKSLFSEVQSSRYFVTLFGAVGMPGSGTVFVHDHARRDRINHLTVWGSPGGLPLYVGYQHAAPHLPAPLVTAYLAFDVHRLAGGVFAGAYLQKEWDYFPRVATSALQQGFYEKMEALQGKNGIYYVGGTLSFETVEHAARYARTLVRERFPVAVP